ncbi:GGDEF domain-containing protein [Luteimonas sp. 3794]|uniref:GGDEF domain-containing protein n=1 Tax=Luteimonas sp. 3794 TaxID=2817730 RepID=UPI00285CA09A|nr:GGDEF domain-containing protein [Luteimonas sp. 3794]MDR6992016.1 diguanylate cyclase (GGDEF)-like protein [Luteimonas sp. 3794]
MAVSAAAADDRSAQAPRFLLGGTATHDGTPMRACDPEALAGVQTVEIPAPAGGWPGAPQAISVFNVFAGEVMVGLGDRVVCGRMHDARTRDSRFRAGVGLVVVPPAGTDDPVRVAWRAPVQPQWIPTIRIGGPSPVQQEDTLRLVVRTACLAIALALAFSALMGYIGARDRTFLAHVAMCLVLLLWQATLNGLSGYPVPWLPVGDHETRWQVAFTAFAFAALQYGLWSQSGVVGLWPALRHGAHWSVRGFVIAGLVVPLLPYAALGAAWWILDHASLLLTVTLTLIAVLSIRRGDRRAFALIAAAAPVIILFIPPIATSRIVVEYRVELIQLVATWFLIVMAYTLTNRYGQLRAQRDAMRQLADTDSLTGLPNRRAGLAQLDRCFAEARRTAIPLSLGFVDIDLFKRINDTHGHDVGDRVLVAVAEALATGVRRRDDVVRMGGEEFLVLLPGVDAQHARERLDAMRHRIAETAATLGVPELQLTASIGVTTLQADDEQAVALLRRADDAMYRAKHAGRNRVMADRDPGVTPHACPDTLSAD